MIEGKLGQFICCLVFFINLLPSHAFASNNQLCGKTWFVGEKGEKIDTPGVVVTLFNDQYGRFEALSSVYGNYRFPDLPSGIYRIKAELLGFRDIWIGGYNPDCKVSVKLCCGKKIRLNIMLTVPDGIIEYAGGEVLIQNVIDMSPVIRCCVTRLPGEREE